MNVAELPMIVSVDDHILEPPDLWTSRLPARFVERGPRVERARAVAFLEGRMRLERSDDEGDPCDWWVYEDEQIPLVAAIAGVGLETVDWAPLTYESVHRGCWDQAARLSDMERDGLSGSLCFPNVVPRFCGQRFHFSKDKELGLACVRAYNDWMLDDWCAGAGRGHLLPITLVPLWDLDLAVAELHRCADKGTVSVAFSENPYMLGLPSIDSGYWDPFFRAAADADVTVSLHIGSSSNVPQTSPESPHISSTCTHFTVSCQSLVDFIFSGTLSRVPNLRLFFAESQAGWVPHVMEQADWLWRNREGSSMGSDLPDLPSSYLQDRVFFSIYNDTVALKNRDLIGLKHMCFETDYPHSVTLYPHTRELALEQCRAAGLDDDEIYALLRGNAINAFRLERVGITA